jgi:hypothetical protein
MEIYLLRTAIRSGPLSHFTPKFTHVCLKSCWLWALCQVIVLCYFDAEDLIACSAIGQTEVWQFISLLFYAIHILGILPYVDISRCSNSSCKSQARDYTSLNVNLSRPWLLLRPVRPSLPNFQVAITMPFPNFSFFRKWENFFLHQRNRLERYSNSLCEHPRNAETVSLLVGTFMNGLAQWLNIVQLKQTKLQSISAISNMNTIITKHKHHIIICTSKTIHTSLFQLL